MDHAVIYKMFWSEVLSKKWKMWSANILPVLDKSLIDFSLDKRFSFDEIDELTASPKPWKVKTDAFLYIFIPQSVSHIMSDMCQI